MWVLKMYINSCHSLHSSPRPKIHATPGFPMHSPWQGPCCPLCTGAHSLDHGFLGKNNNDPNDFDFCSTALADSSQGLRKTMMIFVCLFVLEPQLTEDSVLRDHSGKWSIGKLQGTRRPNFGGLCARQMHYLLTIARHRRFFFNFLHSIDWLIDWFLSHT